ncbi:MAG: hypothetical protein ABJY83_24410 [Roseibium sp.]
MMLKTGYQDQRVSGETERARQSFDVSAHPEDCTRHESSQLTYFPADDMAEIVKSSFVNGRLSLADLEALNSVIDEALLKRERQQGRSISSPTPEPVHWTQVSVVKSLLATMLAMFAVASWIAAANFV